MKDRTRFWVYGLWFVFCLNLIAGLAATWIYGNPIIVVPAVMLSIAGILFLALFDYQRLRTIRDRERVLLKRVEDSWVASLNELERFAPGISLIDLEYEPDRTDGLDSEARISRPYSDTVVLRAAGAALMEECDGWLNAAASKLKMPEAAVRESLGKIGKPNTAEIHRVFEHAHRSLLIRGRVGSGKTVSVMLLTRYLVKKAQHNPGEPIPIVLSLASWNDQIYERFQDWLMDELKLKYDLAETESLNWLIGRRLLLILDALDEVQKDRAKCVEQLEAFLKVFQPPGIVVAVRTEEVAPIGGQQRSDEVPKLEAIINIKELSEEQIHRYSMQAAGLFSSDQRLKLAPSPLNLILVLLVAAKVKGQEIFKSLDERGLLKAFIKTQLGLENEMRLPYQRGELFRRLRWLAREMQRHRQPIFYIDGLQPSWLPERPLLSLRLVPNAKTFFDDRLAAYGQSMSEAGREFKLSVVDTNRRYEKPLFRKEPPVWLARLLSRRFRLYSDEPPWRWLKRPVLSVRFTKRGDSWLKRRLEYSENQVSDYQGIFDLRWLQKDCAPRNARIPIKLGRPFARLFIPTITRSIERQQRISLSSTPWIGISTWELVARIFIKLRIFPAARFHRWKDRWIFGDVNLMVYVLVSRLLATLCVMMLGYVLMIATGRGLGRFFPVDKFFFGLHFVSDKPWDWIIITIIFGGGFAMALPDYLRFRKHDIDTRLKTTLTERGDVKNLLGNVLFCWPAFFCGALLMKYLKQWLWIKVFYSAVFVIRLHSFDVLANYLGPKIVSWVSSFAGQSGSALVLEEIWPRLLPKEGLFAFDIKTALSGATIYAISFGLVFWFRGVGRSPRSDIRTAEKITLTGFVTGMSVLRGILGGMALGAILGFVPALLAAFEYDPLFPTTKTISWTETHYYVSGLQLWVMAILIGLIVGFVTSNLRKVSVIERTYPNHGLWLSLRNTVLIWLVVGGGCSLVIWIYAILLIGSPSATIQDALFLGSVVGMLVAFGYGGLDFLYHITLRCMLSRKGLAPLLQYATFLDNVTHLGFLRRMGGGYTFLHKTLRDVFGRRDESKLIQP